jgi:hypothetical protein
LRTKEKQNRTMFQHDNSRNYTIDVLPNSEIDVKKKEEEKKMFERTIHYYNKTNKVSRNWCKNGSLLKDTCYTLYMNAGVIPSYSSVLLNRKNSGVRNIL